MTFYRLTDTINRGTIVRIDPERRAAEAYNAAYDTWDMFPDWLRYIYPGDIFEGLYEPVNESQVQSLIQTSKAQWKGYWDFAQALVAKEYSNIPSPINGLNYDKYVLLLVDLAQNERERVMFALSGVSLLKNWQALVKNAKLTPPMREGLRLWHTGTKLLWRQTNHWVLRMVLAELEYLIKHGDLADRDATVRRYNTLRGGFSTEEIYLEVLNG